MVVDGRGGVASGAVGIVAIRKADAGGAGGVHAFEDTKEIVWRGGGRGKRTRIYILL